MSRKPTPPAAVVTVPFKQDVYEADSNAATTLGEHQAVAVAEAQRIADQFSYRGDLTLEAVENQMDREGHTHAVSGLAFGASLLIMRALCPHGQFIQRVEARGHNRRAAQRAMSVALRFSKSDKLSLLSKAASSQSKLLELSFLDDEDLVVLDQGGEVSGITLDKIETMTASELRALVRARDDEAQVAKDRSDRQQARLDKMALDLRALKRLPPDELLAKMHTELASVATAGYAWAVANLRPAFEQLAAHYVEHGGGDSKIPMAAALAQVQRELTALRNDFSLPDVSNAADEALAAEVAQWGGKK